MEGTAELSPVGSSAAAPPAPGTQAAAAIAAYSTTQTHMHPGSPSSMVSPMPDPIVAPHARSISVSLGLKGVLADVLQTLSTPATPQSGADTYGHTHTLGHSTSGADGLLLASAPLPPGDTVSSDNSFRVRASDGSGPSSAMLSTRRRSSMSVSVMIPVIPETNEAAEHVPDSPTSGEGAEDTNSHTHTRTREGAPGADTSGSPPQVTTEPPASPQHHGSSSSASGDSHTQSHTRTLTGGGNMRVALHRRRASTGGGPPSLRSPMVSPISFVTNTAAAVLAPAVAQHPSGLHPSFSVGTALNTHETDSGIANVWTRRQYFFKKGSLGGERSDAGAETGVDVDAPDSASLASPSGLGFTASGPTPTGVHHHVRSASDVVASGVVRLRRSESAGASMRSVSPSSQDASVPAPVAGLPPVIPALPSTRSTHQRRRSSVVAYLSSGRRSSETSLTSVPEMLGVPPHGGEDGGAADGPGAAVDAAALSALPALIENIATVVPPEHVEAALIGLVRVVNRFQALFDASDAAAGLQSTGSLSNIAAAAMQADATPSEGGTALAEGAARDGTPPMGTAGNSILRADTPVETARTVASANDPSLLRRDSIGSAASASAIDDAAGRRASMVTDGASDALASPSTAAPVSSAFQVSITREDADMLAALVDVLTTSWNAGFYFAFAAAGGVMAASNQAFGPSSRDDGVASRGAASVDTDAAAERQRSGSIPLPIASLPHSRRSSLSTQASEETSFVAIASLSTRRASHAVGSILGINAEGMTSASARASPKVSTSSEASASNPPPPLLPPLPQAAEPAAAPVPAKPAVAADAARAQPQGAGSRTASPNTVAQASGVDDAGSASEASGGDHVASTLPSQSRDAIALPPTLGVVPNPVVRNTALRTSLRSNSLLIPAGAPLPPGFTAPNLMSPASHRRRSSRVMAREELQRSFQANPAIFDEGTREYVAMLVAPQEQKRPGAAKDKFRSVGHKVAKISSLAKRSTAPSAATASTASATTATAAPHDDKASGASPAAAKADLARRKSGNLQRVDPLARRVAMAEAYALAGMDAWNFDIFVANTKLLQGHGFLPSGDPTAIAASVAASGGSIQDWSGSTSARGDSSLGASVPALFTLPTSPRPVSGRGTLTSAVSTSVDPVAVVESATSPQGPGSRPSLSSPAFGSEIVADPAPSSASSPSSSPAPPAETALVQPGSSHTVQEASGARRFTDAPDTGSGLGAEMLVALTSTALEQVGAVDELGLDRETLAAFLARIARGYHSHPYHNALHGADVCQAMFFLLTTGGLASHCTSELRLAALLAAAVHDVGHPGVNNIFLAQTSHPLALTYNDRSPLENMHAATTFLTMRRAGCDVFAPLTPEQRNQVRGIIIDMVLGTDNAHHFKMIGKIRRRLARAMRPASASTPEDDDYTSSDDGVETGGAVGDAITHPLDMRKASDARLVLMATLHACDISNPAREWGPCVRWTDRITEEFWIQGDKLREASLVVPPMHDRGKPIPRPNMQAGFITALVLPLWTMLTEPAFAQVMNASEILTGLKANLNRYKDMIEQAKSAAALTAAPAST